MAGLLGQLLRVWRREAYLFPGVLAYPELTLLTQSP